MVPHLRHDKVSPIHPPTFQRHDAFPHVYITRGCTFTSTLCPGCRARTISRDVHGGNRVLHVTHTNRLNMGTDPATDDPDPDPDPDPAFSRSAARSRRCRSFICRAALICASRSISGSTDPHPLPLPSTTPTNRRANPLLLPPPPPPSPPPPSSDSRPRCSRSFPL